MYLSLLASVFFSVPRPPPVLARHHSLPSILVWGHSSFQLDPSICWLLWVLLSRCPHEGLLFQFETSRCLLCHRSRIGRRGEGGRGGWPIHDRSSQPIVLISFYAAREAREHLDDFFETCPYKYFSFTMALAFENAELFFDTMAISFQSSKHP